MNTIRYFTKILFALVFTLALLGLFQAVPVVQAEGEQPVPVGIVSAGVVHTCALTPTGAVNCWGSNDYGQLTGTPDSTVHFGTFPGPYIQVSAGSDYTCALKVDGSVDCWGTPTENYGQADDQPGPYVLVSGNNIHTCAVTPTGAVDCWGNNHYGQITGVSDDIVHFGTHPGPYTQVDVGETQTCALTPSGAVDCWGLPKASYLDYGQFSDQPGPYTQVSAGTDHNCALTPSGAVDCWGRNLDGQAADQPGPYTQVNAGAFHTCALTTSGAVDCWGNNYSGQATDQPGPYTQVSGGYLHTCALTPSGGVDCWGADGYDCGQANDQTRPLNQVSAFYGHTCALTPTGAVECWGYNYSGQATTQPGPYTQAGVGGYHTCALTPAGAVDCWGSNYYGQAADQPGPYTQVSPGDMHTCALTPTGSVDCWGETSRGTGDQPGPYTQVSAGYYHNCALKPDGSVDCWGDNDSRQLNGTWDPYLNLATLPGPYTQVSAAYGHTCALKPDGRVDCWGDNYKGKLNGISDDTVHFATHAGPYIQLKASLSHTCALKSDGIVDCWGNNANGEVTGTPNNTIYSGSLPGIFTQVSTGGYYTCALQPSGAVECWGKNQYGQSNDQPIYGPLQRPETILDSAPASPSSSSVTFSFSSDITEASFACQLDTGSWIACDSPQEYTGLAEGDHTFQVRASNTAGVVDLSPATYTWTVDLTPPDTMLDSTPANPSFGGVSFTFSSESGAIFECWLDEGGWTACSSPKVYLALSTDVHTFQVRATDVAGNTDTTPASFTWTVAGITPAPAGIVSTGQDHSCALKPDGSVDCWGSNTHGQATDQPGPYTQVTAGVLHTCALRLDGSIDCWGYNADGQATDQLGSYTQVSAGDSYTCALGSDGSVNCWGHNAWGQAVDQAGPYVQVSAGTSHTCGLTPSGAADCWGADGYDYGQAVDQAGPYTQVSAGYFHTCALMPSGAVDCWGGNAFGQGTDQSGPYTRVHADVHYTCALTPSGAVDCWGANYYGASTDQLGPLTQVSSSVYHSCALTPTGAVDCWGLNSVGQAGDQPGPYGPFVLSQPAITTQPANQTAFVGNAVNFNAAASGNPVPSVHWEVSTDNGATWADIDGATSSTLSFTASLDQNGDQYRAVFTNDLGSATSNAATLTVSKRTATVTLSNLQQTYDGSQKMATVTTNPAGLTVDVTYNGSATPPTNAGSYAVVAAVNDANYQGSANGTLVIGKASATVTLSNLEQTYDGSQKMATVTTNPAGLTVDVTYNGSATSPTNAGSYAVVATINDTNYQGSASGVLVIGKAEATVTLSNLEQTYDGSPKPVTVTTDPAGLSVDVTYNGSTTVPTEVGSYTVVATVNHANYQGSASGNLELVDFHPQPVLAGISPAAAVAGSGDLTLTVTGSDFVDVSIVRWNGNDLTTTYVSATELTAVIPAANLASIQTALVTVFTPAPGGGTTQALPFYVTQSAVQVTGQDVASGTDPNALSGSTTAAATGEGLLAVAGYDANPGGALSFIASGMYFDVYAVPGNTFSLVSIQACGMNPNDKLFWWDVAQGKWMKASPQSYDSGCVTLLVDATSSPSLSQLQGTFFAAGFEPNTAPAANPGGPYLAAINTVLSFDGSASSDPENDPLTYAWTFGDGSTGSGAAPTHTYTAPAIYDVCLTVNDGSLDSEPACTLAVVYNPSGGFVTGGGWIPSPEGAYITEPSLSGKATFGFVSKYQKGASTPTGNTEFRFQAGNFAFQSSSYDWLVVSKDKVNAQFKGSGAVNGALDPNGNAYRFMLWARDGSPDTFRIRIWWEDADGVEHDVYDNGFNQAIGAGSIVVHTGK